MFKYVDILKDNWNSVVKLASIEFINEELDFLYELFLVEPDLKMREDILNDIHNIEHHYLLLEVPSSL
ncbi:MAG: hypothetical protein ACFE8J_08695 [Candidatus Heimdallarchaeota archaeon]